MPEDVQLFFNDTMIAHDPGAGHPECPQRLEVIKESLVADPIKGARFVNATPASAEAVARIHQQRHIDNVEAVRGTAGQFDADTRISEKSVEAAFLAAGAGIQAVDSLLDRTSKRAFVLARPPGHHAEADRSMGFCIFNSIAIAAAHGIKRGCERIMIIDWDVHHGNGTQHSFYDRSDVLVFNTHQFPFYPGTGRTSEVGSGEGKGFTVNCPLPVRMGDGDYQKVYAELLRPVAESYKPDLILVSAGFDAHARDPLGSMEVSTEGYAELCGVVKNLAEQLTGGRFALFLEGGYDLIGLTESVRSCVQVMSGSRAPEQKMTAGKEGERALKFARESQKPFWNLD
jgi:acetoin utilization deacetylase AcuC-like enzyme